MSSDDILNDILDKTSNRKQAIETMLATKLNQAKANALLILFQEYNLIKRMLWI